MKLLITGAASSLGQHLAAGLRQSHTLRLTDLAAIDTDLEFVQSELGHDESTDQLVAGIQGIVHLVYLPGQGDSRTAWLDVNTRCTYNLLQAAAHAGVERVILLSTLELFQGYDEDLAVAEDWRPRPTDAPDTLGPHLAEFVTREFAHSQAFKALVIRLGHVVSAAAAREAEFDPLWVDVRDVVRAVAVALEQDLRPFSVVHLQHQSARARFTPRHHRHHAPEYTPQFNFEEHA